MLNYGHRLLTCLQVVKIYINYKRENHRVVYETTPFYLQLSPAKMRKILDAHKGISYYCPNRKYAWSIGIEPASKHKAKKKEFHRLHDKIVQWHNVDSKFLMRVSSIKFKM